MQGGLLYRLLSGLIALLRRLGVPAALRGMTPRECASYAFGIAYMFQARLWTLLRGEPGWPALQAAWSRAERDPGVRDTLAGTLASTDSLHLIASGEAALVVGTHAMIQVSPRARPCMYARRAAWTSPPTTCNPTRPGAPRWPPWRPAPRAACACGCWWTAT